MTNRFFEKLEEIKMLIHSQKEVINVKELSVFSGWSESYIYKLTMARKIPHFKSHDGGKFLYFRKSEIEIYMTSHRVKTTEELDMESTKYLYLNKKK